MATQPESLPANLTGREAKVLQLVAKGMSNRQIALEMGLSAKTVANHLTHIFNKTMCENRVSATAFALRNGLV
jgi:DNA-binding NarL/FixJ family response regulator